MATYVTRTSAPGGEFDLPGADTGEAGQLNILDASAWYAGADLEAALNEIEAAIGGASSTLRPFPENNLLVDNESVVDCLERLDLFVGDLVSQNPGEGASLVGIEDAADSLVGATVEAALAELALPPTLTPAAEVGNVIAVAFQGPGQIAQYLARVYDTNGLPVAAAFTVAETGAGAEIFGSGTPTLLFRTSASGGATISVTDVAGASAKSPLLVIESASASAGAKAASTCAIVLVFDGV